MKIWGRVGLSLLLVGAYGIACIAALGHAGYLHVAGLAWVILAVVTSRLWHRRARHAFAVVLGGASAALVWSLVMLDFPPEAVERASVLSQWVLVVGPVLLAVAAGAVIPEGYLLAGGQMLLLGVIGVFPVGVWNVETHVAGGWWRYPYPTPVAGMLSLVLFTGMGVGGAWLGHRARQAIRREKKPSPRA